MKSYLTHKFYFLFHEKLTLIFPTRNDMTKYYAHNENQTHINNALENKEIHIAETDKSTANLAEIENNPREAGNLKGQIWISDDFDEPMSKEELALWYDAPIFPVDE